MKSSCRDGLGRARRLTGSVALILIVSFAAILPGCGGSRGNSSNTDPGLSGGTGGTTGSPGGTGGTGGTRSGGNAGGSAGGAGQVSTLAGTGTAGHSDGAGSTASFNYPKCMAVDSAGNIFVADYNNNLVRKITPVGEVATLAGSGTVGHTDGLGRSASFNGPAAVAVDISGTLYVADEGSSRVRKIAPDGTVTTFAGSVYGDADGAGGAAMFEDPAGIAVDGVTGTVFVSDRSANRIRKIAATGEVTTIAGTGQQGFTDGSGAVATFDSPNCIALDGNGNLFVADTGNNLIRRIDTSGNVTTLAGSGGYGSDNGTGSVATFRNPTAVTVDLNGHVFVADQFSNLIREISPSGEVSTFAGTGEAGSTDGTAAAATFWLPHGIAFDAVSHSVIVSDQFTGLIRKITVQ